MKDNILKIFGLVLAVQFAHIVNGFAADDRICVKLPGSLVEQVCVGDIVSTKKSSGENKSAIRGEVTAFEPAITDQGDQISVMTVQTPEGPTKLTTEGFVLVTPGACIHSTRVNYKICVDDLFKSDRDGRKYEVVGFAVATGSGFGSNVVVAEDPTGRRDWQTSFDASEIYQFFELMETGRLLAYGSCNSEVPFLNVLGYGWLPGCAKTDALKKVNARCNKFCDSRGQVEYLYEAEANIDKAPECRIEANWWPPHKKVCDFTIAAKCTCAN